MAAALTPCAAAARPHTAPARRAAPQPAAAAAHAAAPSACAASAARLSARAAHAAPRLSARVARRTSHAAPRAATAVVAAAAATVAPGSVSVVLLAGTPRTHALALGHARTLSLLTHAAHARTRVPCHAHTYHRRRHAGGVGKRMGANMPKQYLPLRGQPIALYSLQTFAAMPEVGEVVVVCDPSYRDVFQGAKLARALPLKFALPGTGAPQIKRRALVFAALRSCCARALTLACLRRLPLLPPRATSRRQGASGLRVQRPAGDCGQRGARGGARLGAPARHPQGCAAASRCRAGCGQHAHARVALRLAAARCLAGWLAGSAWTQNACAD
jgi:hypothetical protein